MRRGTPPHDAAASYRYSGARHNHAGGHGVGLSLTGLLTTKGVHVLHTFDEDQQNSRRQKRAFFQGAARIKATTLHSFKGWEVASPRGVRRRCSTSRGSCPDLHGIDSAPAARGWERTNSRKLLSRVARLRTELAGVCSVVAQMVYCWNAFLVWDHV